MDPHRREAEQDHRRCEGQRNAGPECNADARVDDHREHREHRPRGCEPAPRSVRSRDTSLAIRPAQRRVDRGERGQARRLCDVLLRMGERLLEAHRSPPPSDSTAARTLRSAATARRDTALIETPSTSAHFRQRALLDHPEHERLALAIGQPIDGFPQTIRESSRGEGLLGRVGAARPPRARTACADPPAFAHDAVGSAPH